MKIFEEIFYITLNDEIITLELLYVKFGIVVIFLMETLQNFI